MSQGQSPRPVRIEKDGEDGLIITWSDGQRGRVTWRQLRAQCPCAACREERAQPPNPFRVLRPAEILSGPLRPVTMTPVGYYAYKIVWSDGHDTGLFTFDFLRSICEGLESPRPGSSPGRNL
jgi:DUF971 family protein